MIWALKILLKAKGVTNFGYHKTNFSDVTRNDWFYPYITYVENKGIIEGYTEIFGKSGPVRNFYSFPYLLGPGSSGKDVQNLKEILTQLGYYSGVIDMTYDQELTDAVINYQTAKNIDPVGYMGKITRSAILDENLSQVKITTFRPNNPITREETSKIAVLITAL